MTTWKPGDRFTIEFELAIEEPGDAAYRFKTTDGHYLHTNTMARAVKLPPKARPVRKGDEIVYGRQHGIYVGAVGEFRIAWDAPSSSPYVINHEGLYTHADGAEIDWEASE